MSKYDLNPMPEIASTKPDSACAGLEGHFGCGDRDSLRSAREKAVRVVFDMALIADYFMEV